MSAADRLIAAIRAIIRAEVPGLKFAGLYEYTVQRSNGGTADVSPTDTTLGLPSLTGLSLSPSILGEVISGAPSGAVALVQFVNGDPARPEVVSLSMPSASATVDATGTLSLGPSGSVELAGGLAPVARQGDAVTVYLGTAPITVTGTIGGSTPFTGFITFLGPAMGIIVGGSPRVTA